MPCEYRSCDSNRQCVECNTQAALAATRAALAAVGISDLTIADLKGLLCDASYITQTDCVGYRDLSLHGRASRYKKAAKYLG